MSGGATSVEYSYLSDGISPYAYCAGNPVSFVDSDGKKIIISGSEEFVKRVHDAESILQSHEISVLQSLRDSRQVYTIRDAHDNNNMNAFDGETRTIYWNPKESAYDSNKKVLRSPLVRLVHELGHASQFEEDYVKFILLATTDSPHYSNQAEKIIIQGLEQIAARAFGEIRDDQVTRSGHYGRVGPDLGSLSVINQSSYCAWMNNPLPEVHESPELFDIAKLMK